MELLVLDRVRVELLLVLKGDEGGTPCLGRSEGGTPCLEGGEGGTLCLGWVEVELLLVLEGVMVEILVLERVRVELLVLGVSVFLSNTRPILLSFKIDTRAVMTVMFLLHDLVQIGI